MLTSNLVMECQYEMSIKTKHAIYCSGNLGHVEHVEHLINNRPFRQNLQDFYW